MVDAYVNQVLRATVDTEQDSGPDMWVTVQQATGNARIMLQRWPVLAIQNVQVASTAVFPRQYITVTPGLYDVERPILGIAGTTAPAPDGQGGQAILIAPGYVDWTNGRNGYTIRVTYINGWPHTSLTAAATAGSSTISVDDCTGWAISTGIVGGGSQVAPVTGTTTAVIYDSGAQEVIQATAASVNAGAGTLTLQNPLAFNHNPGTMVSTFPASIIWATILFGTAMALTRGATATIVHEIPGAGAGAVPSREPSDLIGEAELLLNPYRRTILFRVEKEIYFAIIFGGWVRDHLCRVRACVRPDHLEAVPIRTNTLRGALATLISIQTHCSQGHLYDESNTVFNLKAEVICLECVRSDWGL